MSTDDDRWEPVRRGTIYCSPACGGGCTHGAWVLATNRANELARRMGPGWETRVWENLGWHYEVHKGCCHLHVNRYGDNTRYTAYLNSATQFVKSSDSPEAAVVAAAMEAVAHVHTVTADLAILNTLEEEE